MSREKIALRWTEERSRLGFSQADMARKVNVTRETIRKYENGLSVVNAEVLSEVAAYGFDVQYILTGIRSLNVESQSETPSKNEKTTISIESGVGQALDNSNITFINTDKHITQTVADVKPGEDHITDKQASKLQMLVKDIVEKESKLKKRPATFRSVWGALNSFCSVPKYRLIPLSDYEKAKKYLDQWMGRLNSMASAPVKDGDNWRKRHYAYIKINSKGEIAAQALENYLHRKFKATSLTQLSNEELEVVYRYVASKKNKRR